MKIHVVLEFSSPIQPFQRCEISMSSNAIMVQSCLPSITSRNNRQLSLDFRILLRCQPTHQHHTNGCLASAAESCRSSSLRFPEILATSVCCLRPYLFCLYTPFTNHFPLDIATMKCQSIVVFLLASSGLSAAFVAPGRVATSIVS